MMYPEDQDSELFDYPDSAELFGYLYSFLLFRKRVDIRGFDAETFGTTTAHVQAEMDIWVASVDPTPLRPGHPSFKYRFSQFLNGIRWYLQPSGAKLVNVRFNSVHFGSESVYAEIDLGANDWARKPKVLSIFPGNPELDFVVAKQAEGKLIRMLSVTGTGQRALLFPKSKQNGNWEVMPLQELSFQANTVDAEHEIVYKTIQLLDFIPSV